MAAAEQPEQETAEPKKSSPLFGLIKAVAFVSVLVIVEVVAASLLIPSPASTEELARKLAAAKAGEDSLLDEEGTTITEAQTQSDEPMVEVMLGKPFNVTQHDPTTDTSRVVEMEVFALVLAKEQEEFDTQFEKNLNRVREQVGVTVRSADTNQLKDAGLGLIKRKILEKTNRALGKPLVREILITRFDLMER